MIDVVFDRGRYDEDLSELFTQLWDCDVNRCEPGCDYTIDLQGIVVVIIIIIVIVVVVAVTVVVQGGPKNRNRNYNLSRLQCYCANKILLTQQNNQTCTQTPAKILATTYMVVHTTSHDYRFKNHFLFLDTHAHRRTC